MTNTSSEASSAAVQPVAILGTPGEVREPARFDDDTLLTVLGSNSGNLMFQYAASQIIEGPQRHISLAEIPYSQTERLKEAKALVFPAANHLRLGADWTGLNNYLDQAKLPLIVFGLGAQSPKIGGERETIAALKADPGVTRMVSIFRERGVFVSVRGSFTQKVCEELGLPGTEILGCPSALINDDPQLGRKMADRIAALGTAEAPRIAVTAAAPFEIREDLPKRDLERRLFHWVHRSEGLYVQQSGGKAAMNAANGRWYDLSAGPRKSIHAVLAPEIDPVEFWAFMARSARFYLSVPQWREEMAGMDLVLGTRLHGNMAAIAAGTPGVIIAHDSRTGELGDTMHLPRLDMADAMAAGSLQEAISQISFDGAEFDAWRGRTAATLARAFERIGLPINPRVRGLAA